MYAISFPNAINEDIVVFMTEILFYDFFNDQHLKEKLLLFCIFCWLREMRNIICVLLLLLSKQTNLIHFDVRGTFHEHSINFA
jgi:hypothetical protein